MKLIFWLSFILILIPYLGYPAYLVLIGVFKKRKIDAAFYEPSVSFIIPCYNESLHIKNKIENLLNLDYPKNRIEIIVISDGSTDDTERICLEYIKTKIKLITLRRVGKNAAMNIGAKESNNEILIFSDATAMLKNDSLRSAMKYFNDKRVGLVSGGVKMVSPEDSLGGNGLIGNINKYFEYENFIRKREGELGCLVSATGTFCAVRRQLFENIPEGVADDFYLPLLTLKKGFLSTYTKECLSLEEASIYFWQEFYSRIRAQRQAIFTLYTLREFLNPLKHTFIYFQLILHKILRWAASLALLFMLIFNAFLLNENLYRLFFILQAFIYFLAIIGFLLKKEKVETIPILSLPLHFCVNNVAILFASLTFKKCEKKWVTNR